MDAIEKGTQTTGSCEAGMCFGSFWQHQRMACESLTKNTSPGDIVVSLNAVFRERVCQLPMPPAAAPEILLQTFSRFVLIKVRGRSL
jgi:hypothetical protein